MRRGKSFLGISADELEDIVRYFVDLDRYESIEIVNVHPSGFECMEHTDAPDEYYSNDLWLDSPLTDDEREQFRDLVRRAVLDVEEYAYFTPDHNAISSICIQTFDERDVVDVEVHLDPREIAVTPEPDEYEDENGEVIGTSDPSYLRDLGDTWSALEYDIISELVLLLDLPEFTEELVPYVCYNDQTTPQLIATFGTPTQTSFSMSARVPPRVKRIYEDAEFELARTLGIPMEPSV